MHLEINKLQKRLLFENILYCSLYSNTYFFSLCNCRESSLQQTQLSAVLYWLCYVVAKKNKKDVKNNDYTDTAFIGDTVFRPGSIV